ncbi:hypothetical protein KUTeg_000349 [Tegillarca granosa]|uniref:Uncharacterized protein n=1 Tax=Tegillarca granosa TaxID=220873 RepID=A0ABQ9FX98_TEGGR|nr:hypothetical protein KUTeg_000349 [Tegillarca granosa]
MASSAEEPRRIDILAYSKRVPDAYQEDRRSVYWVDSEPPKPGKNGVTVVGKFIYRKSSVMIIVVTNRMSTALKY